MSTTFKVGDTAEFTEYYMGHEVGERFTVTGVEPSLNIFRGAQLVQGRKPNNHSGVYSGRLKLVEATAHEYKEGDRVQITIPAGNVEAFGGAFFKTGEGTVEQLHSSAERLLVRGEASKDGESWWVHKKFVTPLVEEELPFEVGSRVRAKAGYLGGISEGIVTRLYGDFGGDIEIAWETGYAVAGFTLGARRSGLEVISSPVAERPKATPVTAETKPQIGDTIVAFWGDLSKGEVETRAKGVVARIDADGNYEAADGNCIDWDDDLSPETSDSVFIVERAPKPEPVKVDPNQKWIDAPLGSIARDTKNNFVWRKTSDNEWSLLTSYGDIVRDRNDSTVGISAVLFTP